MLNTSGILKRRVELIKNKKMKNIILNVIVGGLVCFSNVAISQNTPSRTTKSQKEKILRTQKKTPTHVKRTSQKEMKGTSSKVIGPAADHININQLMSSVSSITNIPERVKYKFGFLVEGVAGPNNRIEITNKVRWKQKGYNYERVKEYDVIKVTSESDGTWDAKMENPYRGVPEGAYNIKFEISSHQYPQDITATLPPPSIVYGTMAPPEIIKTDREIKVASNPGPGGMYQETFTTVSGKGIPNMNIEVSVLAEYQTPAQRYNSGTPNMVIRFREGETKSVKISSNGTWSVKLKVPNPYSQKPSFGLYYPKLVVKATQSSSPSDVSSEGEKKFDIISI